MRCLSLIAMLLLVSIIGTSALAEPPSAESEIRAALDRWTSDFNAGLSDRVCSLFASDLRADVRGAAERDFKTQCALLRRVLADPDRAYRYAFNLKEVLADHDTAVVRLTWTTTTRVAATGAVEITEDEGLDIFRRESPDNWRITRYMAYERP
jgi:hypothetical protein